MGRATLVSRRLNQPRAEENMRPTLRLLETDLIERILAEARDILCKLGVEIHNEGVLRMLAFIPGEMIDRSLGTVPRSFKLFDALGNQTHDFEDGKVYFTPGSTAINVLDGATGEMRVPDTADYIRYVKVISGLKHIAADLRQLPSLFEPAIRREAGGHGGLHGRGLRDHEGPPTRGARR
jgi:trimethylamine:corrinoid methyltransferase-like protein